MQTTFKAEQSDELWPFYNSLHSEINALKVAVSEEKKEKGLEALMGRSRKQMESALNGVQFDGKAKAEVLAVYDAQLKQQELDFNVKRVGIHGDVCAE